MDLGLLQRDVGERLGAHETSVYLWEADRAIPGLKWWPLIFEFLGYDPRPTSKTIGERLVRYREGLGWSQERLANALKVDPTTLSRWELGKKAPWGAYRQKVEELLRANLFKVSVWIKDEEFTSKFVR